nr:uncharacterized protein LOC112995149 [Dromaius novaehollandiae]
MKTIRSFLWPLHGFPSVTMEMHTGWQNKRITGNITTAFTNAVVAWGLTPRTAELLLKSGCCSENIVVLLADLAGLGPKYELLIYEKKIHQPHESPSSSCTGTRCRLEERLHPASPTGFPAQGSHKAAGGKRLWLQSPAKGLCRGLDLVRLAVADMRLRLHGIWLTPETSRYWEYFISLELNVLNEPERQKKTAMRVEDALCTLLAALPAEWG